MPVFAMMGAVMPESIEAVGQLSDKRREVSLLDITSVDRLNAGWTAATKARAQVYNAPPSVIERLLSGLAPRTLLISVLDAHSSTLLWIGGAGGHRLVSLGVEHFGQSGTIKDLYRHFEIDARAILEAIQSAMSGKPLI